VRLHVETQEAGVVLYRAPLPAERDQLDPASRALGIPVCHAPCDRLVDGREGQAFRFAGRYVTPSSSFVLVDRGGDLTLDVNADGNDKLVATEPPRKPVPGAPRVHVETEETEVTLFREPFPRELARLDKRYRALGIPICRVPCDRVIDGRAGQVFFFGGKDVVASPPFLLTDQTGDLAAEVHTSPYGKRGGPAVLGTGAGMLAVGVPLGVAGLQRDSRAAGLGIAGCALAGVGLGAVAGGIAMIVKSRTSVQLRPRATLDGGVLRF
jgi:hypothetical protein